MTDFIPDADTADSRVSPFHPPLPRPDGRVFEWGRLYGSGAGLAIAGAARDHDGPVIVLTSGMPATERLEHELRFYLAESDPPVLILPDRETLPYDAFSPHQDIVSERLDTLQRLPGLRKGILLAPVATAMVRLAPRAYLDAFSLRLDVGERIDTEHMRARLARSGYRLAAQVMEHGEFCIRGNLIDLYPMGSALPFRLELLDDEIESMRTFDPETQRSVERVERIRLLPAGEFPLHEEAIEQFRREFRRRFAGDPQRSPIYRDVSQGLAPAGIEYYLPLFFDHTETLFDYLPANSLVLLSADTGPAIEQHWAEIGERYEQLRHDAERPLVPPEALFLTEDDITAALAGVARCQLQTVELETTAASRNLALDAPPGLSQPARARHPLESLLRFLDVYAGRVLLIVETPGRRESLLAMLHDAERFPRTYQDWRGFLDDDAPLGIAVAGLERGLVIEEPAIAVITEAQIFGEYVMQRRRRNKRGRDAEAVIRNLTELAIGSPVVHEEHGVGRYLGLQMLTAGGVQNEFLKLEYAGGDKLYVPVSSLQLISRYTGAAPEQAPLHRLGSGQWQRARRRAAERARDVAAELLDIYARREARPGRVFALPDDQYAAFAAGFPFEETPDQLDAINDVIADMTAGKTMDRLVCGDVGFGKTEVAMRAAFVAVQGGAQVAVLVPTTLLAQQHYHNFRDRFADLPVRIEVLSRFRSGKEQDTVLAALAEGKVDIIIGTHKLLQPAVRFKDLGLVILDEEHRFGVRQKERLKALRAEVDILTLTATPIPRTLNMALSNLRDLSIIATPPQRRLAVKSFVREWSRPLLREACLREIHRGGQVYFLHNEVRTIDRIAAELREIVPEASLRVAHGQMAERELEQIMQDFYHQRFNLLVCTTIIESGIDIPNANTIILNRADHLGLAQLYQLRGRVGRSHHQAYAYLIVPPRGAMTADAVKRLEAIESIEALGAGFTLATHDLEIRGAGELLGEEQSGQIQEVGFSMYMELLERAVDDLKSGRTPRLDDPIALDAEIELGEPALIPEDYLPDVHGRLVMYKRIASAADPDELRELQVEMIDRFGLLPDPVKHLFEVARLKLTAVPLGVRKIELTAEAGRIVFGPEPKIDSARLIGLIQKQPDRYRLHGADRLQFKYPAADLGGRLQATYDLLARITGDKTTAPAG
ncbi:MAG: transcription-repair coupling factor [Gammaproteobacteria bacterium]|nr:transcription-repair coupling factor [Gammaproteobacteria bacterium]